MTDDYNVVIVIILLVWMAFNFGHTIWLSVRFKQLRSEEQTFKFWRRVVNNGAKTHERIRKHGA